MENITKDIYVSGEIETQSTTTFQVPKQYNYKPKEDITTYELALILPIFAHNDLYPMNMLIDELSDNCKRHFEEVE